MPIGSFDYTPGDDSPPTGPATTVVVCRYNPAAPSGGRYSILSNVYCHRIEAREGAHPSTAQFSYIVFDSGERGEDPAFPSQFEETWPIASAPNAYKVVAGDRLVALAIDPNGDYRVRWQGFAQVPQADLSPSRQWVTFAGVGVEVRCWDSVIDGSLWRGGDRPSTPGTPGDPSTYPVATGLPCRFNPDDRGNCTPDGGDETLDDGSGNQYPVFLEPSLEQQADDAWGPVAVPWTLGRAARYLMAAWNTAQDADGSPYVDNPDFGPIDALLQNRAPLQGADFVDPADPATYVATDIVVRDTDATNRPWPEVLAAMLALHGFRLRFVTEGTPAASGGAGPVIEEPYTYLDLYRLDAAGPVAPKQVYLPPTRGALDIDQCNVAALDAVNDFHSVANAWAVESRPARYEVSVLLAPAFRPNPADAQAPDQRQYLKSNLDGAPQGVRQMYRLYIADELGEGCYYNAGGGWVSQAAPFDFGPIFGPDAQVGDAPVWAKRYRPAIRTLFSADPAGKALSAQLALSRDYAPSGPAGEPPCPWDGTGTWQSIDGGYSLLGDRLGIYVDVEDANAWAVGRANPPASPAAPQEPSGSLQAITSLALWTVQNPGKIGRQDPFYLRLTCVIESDQVVEAEAPRRAASPYPFAVARRVDARDHFAADWIDPSSAFYASNPAADPAGGPRAQIAARDDTAAATSLAEQMRAAHELPPIAGTIRIPWFAAGYSVGDLIDLVAGRDASLRANAGAEQGEGPNYPSAVAITWDLRGPAQSTILQLSDRRLEPRH